MKRTETAVGDKAAWFIAVAIVAVVAAATVLFHGHLSDLVGQLPWFLRSYALIIGTGEVIGALLLVRRALRLRTRRGALVAAAYAWSAPLVLENLLTLPGIMGPHGALAHQTPPWCWALWHLGWAAFIIPFAWLPDRTVRNPIPMIASGFAGAVAFGFVAANADVWLPPVLAGADTVSPLLFNLGWTTIGLLLFAAFGLVSFRGSTLDALLLVAVFALALDEAFVLTTSVRFSVGTYLARTLGAINALAILLAIALENAKSRAESVAQLQTG